MPLLLLAMPLLLVAVAMHLLLVAIQNHHVFESGNPFGLPFQLGSPTESGEKKQLQSLPRKLAKLAGVTLAIARFLSIGCKS